ncbi:MAG: hypothetical protein JSS97_17385 [Actinobacteria bacterium]|nr:hypothetical protein [Actinomycetota bacterium]
MLPVAFLFTPDGLLSVSGGFAAAIAIGAFFGQATAEFGAASEEARRRRTVEGGLAAVIVVIGLILVSIGWR